MNLKQTVATLRKQVATAKAKAAASGKPAKPANKKLMPKAARTKLSGWGAKSFDALLSVDTSDKKYAYLGADEIALAKQFKEDVDVLMISAQLFKKDVKDLKYYNDNFQYTMKAFGIESGDEGFEWIPTLVASSYIDEFNLDRKVSGLFMEVRMPSNPFKWPVLTNGAVARKLGQATAGAKQVFNTDETIQFDAVKLANRYELPEELNEDSAPDIVRAIRIELIEGQEKSVEIAILEGDSTGAMHNFSQLPDVAGGTTIASILATTPETAWDGIRVRLQAADPDSRVDVGDAAISESELSDGRAKMGKFGVDPSQLVLISGPKVYNQLLQLDDVRTMEQLGAKATVITGQLAAYEGMPVIVSEYLREDLDTTGVNSATVPNNIRGSVLMVNRKRWFTGLRRPVQVRVDSNKTELDVLDMVSFQRYAFQAVLKADGSNYATESSGAEIFNIAL